MGYLALLAAVAAAGWLVSLWLHPFRPCPRCTRHATRRGGAGRNRGSSRRRFGTCRRCDGTGRVRRIGAKTIHGSISRLMQGTRRKDS